MKLFSSLINTCFFVGMTPLVPGTLGSIFALIIWLFFSPPLTLMIISLLLLIFLSYITILFELRDTDDKDPQHIVIDEAIGMWIALLFISPVNFLSIASAFIIFRMLDIFKPSIIGRSEKIQGAGGILMDDILSGMITCMVCLGISSI